MKTQTYSFFSAWLFTLILTIAVILPQTTFAQTYNNTATDPIFTENITSPELFGVTINLLLSAETSSSEENEKIESLKKEILNNLYDLKDYEWEYNEYKNKLESLNRNTLMLGTILHYRDNRKTSYDSKKLKRTIKTIKESDTYSEFNLRYITIMTKLKKRIDSQEKKNTQLLQELNLLLTNMTNQSYTPEESDNYYRQKCPNQNPGDPKIPNRLKYKFDTNNNPNNGDYVLCGYWRNGDLSYEIPHANNKKHGISYYNFTNSSNPKEIIPYTEGKKDGSKISFLKTSKGNIYKWKESEFSEGKIRRGTIFREHGNVSNVSLFSSDGKKKINECWYREDGTSTCKNY